MSGKILLVLLRLARLASLLSSGFATSTFVSQRNVLQCSSARQRDPPQRLRRLRLTRSPRLGRIAERRGPSGSIPQTAVCTGPRSRRNPGPVVLVAKVGTNRFRLCTDGGTDWAKPLGYRMLFPIF